MFESCGRPSRFWATSTPFRRSRDELDGLGDLHARTNRVRLVGCSSELAVDKTGGGGVIVCAVAKPLVIVESPAKARTIEGFLGGEFTVLASMGHIRDLPAKGLSVDVENDFKVEYEVHASKKDTIAQLKRALKEADQLYLATDEDREGEAISLAPARGAQTHRAGQADGVPRDHPQRDRARHRGGSRRRLRARRRAGEPPHRRPPLRLPGVGGVLAQDPTGPVGRPGPVAERASRGGARARAHGVRGGQLLGPRRDVPHRAGLHRPARDHRREPGRRQPRLRQPRPDQARRRRRARRGGGATAEGGPRRPAVRGHVGRDQAVHVETEAAVHHLDPAAGRRLPPADEQPPGDVDRPGPLRGRLHHLHADRQHHAVGHRHRGGPSGDRAAVRPRVPHGPAAHLRQEVEERPGGP